MFGLNAEAYRLREWLDRPEIKNAGEIGGDFARLVSWAKERIETLEATTAPENLDCDLKAKGLFPEADDLADPLGEPPGNHAYW